jgi:hypothetical protein
MENLSILRRCLVMSEYNLIMVFVILSLVIIYALFEAVNYVRIVIREELKRVGLTKKENKK